LDPGGRCCQRLDALTDALLDFVASIETCFAHRGYLRLGAAMTSADLRIAEGVERGPRVSFRCDGREVEAHEGESLAAALWASGLRADAGERTEGPPFRVLFCAMGVCQQCVVLVDGVRVEACRVPVRAGLDVRTQS